MTPEEEKAYLLGRRAMARHIVGHCHDALDEVEKPLEALALERSEVVAQLRQVCKDFGDNDWPDSMHLGDVVEKHLSPYLYAGEDAAAAQVESTKWLLHHINAVFDVDIESGWKLLSSTAASRFSGLREAAEKVAAGEDVDGNPVFASAQSGPGLFCRCSSCEKDFLLTADRTEASRSTCIDISACTSGGIYDVVVRCPHCDHRHDMM